MSVKTLIVRRETDKTQECDPGGHLLQLRVLVCVNARIRITTYSQAHIASQHQACSGGTHDSFTSLSVDTETGAETAVTIGNDLNVREEEIKANISMRVRIERLSFLRLSSGCCV